MTLTFGKVSNSDFRNWRQVLISDGSGLFCGGTQRTELAMRQSTNSSVSSARSSYTPLARPCLSKVAYSRSPAQSPVKGRPVRLAPCSPGASPAINRRAVSGPKLGTGSLNQSGYLRRLSCRNACSRGQSGQSVGGVAGDFMSPEYSLHLG